MLNSETNYSDSYKHFVVLCLVLFCPVLVTDFLLSAGFVPISYVVTYSLIWFDPIMLIHLSVCAVYIVLFYGYTRIIFKKNHDKPKTRLLITMLHLFVLLFIASQQIYMDFVDDSDDRKNYLTLYSSQFQKWNDLQFSNKQMEIAKERLKRLKDSQPD